MPACCGNSGTPFVQTRFLGATVTRFSAQADWNGAGGGLQVELVEDLCSGDAFNPPGIGMPVYFVMGGFTHGGILQNWKQNDSAAGPKSYTVNVISPRDIVEGTQVILSSYNGPTFGVPNLTNVYGWLEATYGAVCAEAGFQGIDNFPSLSSSLTYPPAPGFGGAINNEVGIPWQLVRTALNAILNGSGGDYGSPMTFRGHTYLMDLSELPLLNGSVRIGGENMTLEDLIAHVCGLAGVDYFYELITVGAGCGGTTSNIVKLRTTGGTLDESAELVDVSCGSHIDARLSLGTIGSTIAASSCVNRYGRGLELKLDVTNAFITGEFRQEIWQIEFDDEEGSSGNTDYACMGQATIWPYWGKNPDGTIVLGEECSDATFPEDINDLAHGHHFVVQTGHLDIGISEWDITVFELQAALVSQGHWESWLGEREPEKYAKISGLTEHDIYDKRNGKHGLMWAEAFRVASEAEVSADETMVKFDDAVSLYSRTVTSLGAPDDLRVARNTKLYDFVRKYAQEHYGRKFLVRLPFLCKRFNSDTPWTLETNWTTTDSGWTEWPVLGLPNPGWVLEQFRADDGKIRCFLKFTSERPMLLDNLSKEDYFAIDARNVFVAGEAKEIVWITPTDARAIVTISGPMRQYNPYGMQPEWLMGFALTGFIHGHDKKAYMEVAKDIGNDKMAIGMTEPFLMPVAVAVPLQSTRLVYGPWFAKKDDVPGFDFFGGGSLFGGSDKGKTTYQREAGFAPWNFGSWALMDSVAYNTASAMLGEQYVAEMGDITFPGAPIGPLGSLIAAGGPAVSQIDVQVGRGNGAVLTTYRMRTHTPDTGKLAKQRIDQVRHAAGVALKAERIFKKYALDRLRNQFDARLAQQLLQWKTSVGLSGTSSHSMLGGRAGRDIDGPALDTVGRSDFQYYHKRRRRNTVTVQQPSNYEADTQDLEPHARTTVVASEARKDVRLLRADLGHRWRRRAYMESIGMFRPFSTLPHTQKAAQDDAYFLPHWRDDVNRDRVLGENDCSTTAGQAKFPPEPGCPTDEGEYLTNNVDFFSHEQVPPIFCKEQHLPINIATLSPFLRQGRSLLPGWSNGGVCMTKSPNTSAGHDIEYIARDGVYPAHLSVRHPGDNYSANHWYRGVALRAPLILAGWGFDIDNKPVPNESVDYPNNPKMKFEQDWLRKPQKWMCGPVDLRWDYKRHVWTAPSPMKMVKLELMEHLGPDQCANAILYHDQEQYDYDGSPLDCETACERSGYKVKVWSNAMYPVPKGWRIMAYFDTTHNRYHMINHDPFPIVEAELDDDIGCGDGMATITGPAGGGSDAMDPCNALVDMKVKITNSLNQPLCEGRKVFVWVFGFDYGANGEPGPTLDDCNAQGVQPIRARGVIIQAEFKPECVVTHLELMEFYCWGYDISCDEEDVTIYPQGDVETCWDWCFKLDGVANFPEYTGDTETDTHSHTGTVTGRVSGPVSGYTDTVDGFSAAGSGTTEADGATPSGEATGIGFFTPECSCSIVAVDASAVLEATHDLTCDITGDVIITLPSGVISGEALSDAHSHTGFVSPDGESVGLLVDPFLLVFSNATYTSSTFVSAWKEQAVYIYDDGDHDHFGVTSETESHTHQIAEEISHNHSAYVIIDDPYGHSHFIPPFSGWTQDAVEMDITFDLSFSMPLTIDEATHTHDVQVTLPGEGSAALSGLDCSITGTIDISAADLADNLSCDMNCVSGSFSVDSTFTLPSHTHDFNISDIDFAEHSHAVDLEFNSYIANGVVNLDTDEHLHSLTIPLREVNLCLDSAFDIDIDSRFVPSPCVIRIAVLNKNFWEYYWYALCICTRAMWTQAEMGPATCDTNNTPDCDDDCENVDCGAEVEYDCVTPARQQYSLAAGEDVSWFGTATDTTLLDVQTTCSDYTLSACSADATCDELTLPAALDCTGGDEVAIDDNDTTVADEWDNGVGDLDDYCPSGALIEGAFLRDVNAGLFDFISDDAGDHGG